VDFPCSLLRIVDSRFPLDMDSRSGKHQVVDSEVGKHQVADFEEGIPSVAVDLGPVGNQNFADTLGSADVLGTVDALDSVGTRHSCFAVGRHLAVDSEEDILDSVVDLGVVENLGLGDDSGFENNSGSVHEDLGKLIVAHPVAHVLAYSVAHSHSNSKEYSPT